MILFCFSYVYSLIKFSDLMQKKTIIITSNEAWGDVWFSKQHYANELANLGHIVYFLNPPLNWSIKNLFSFGTEQNKKTKNLTIVSLYNNLPVRVFPKFFTKLNDFLNSYKLKKNIPFIENNLVLWKFDPYRFLSLFPLKLDKSIYHVADPYVTLWQDKLHVKNADLIICTSPKYKPLYDSKNKKVIVIPHGVSDEEFNEDHLKKENIKKTYGDFALVVGTITASVNIQMIRKIALEGYRVVVIGPDKHASIEWEKIKNMNNVTYLGVIHAKELKYFTAGSKVCLIAYSFDLNLKKFSGSPIKTINYLAQFKPIISSISTEIDPLINYGIYEASNEEEFINFVKKGMNGELLVDEKKILDYLNTVNYKNLIQKIFDNIH